MSEPEYVRTERRMTAMRDAVREPYVLGTITVALDGDAWNWDHNAPYVKGTCSQCGAVVVMAASSRDSMRHLALAIAYTWCKQRGHVQDYDDLLKKAGGQLHLTHRPDYLRGLEAGKRDMTSGERYQRLPTTTDPERAYSLGYMDGWEGVSES